ncbi:hypothetical protein Tco_0170584, partial [Tanacetum coccineum]
IADEDAMDKEVADKVKDHKRKHDSDDDEDDDDDEGPSAGSNQGRSTKKRRSDSAAFGSAKPPPKDDDQSSKKPMESDASASKQHPVLTSTGWQITDTRDAGADSSMHRSDPESEHSEQSSDGILQCRMKGMTQIWRTLTTLTFPRCRPLRGLEELVPSLWVESEREYDISAVYGITHWWFRRKEFYIKKHSESSDREAVRSQMRVLSVISFKEFEKYGYNYLREIILCRADYQEYKISEKDFKNLHPNDFEDLFLLNTQEKLNHLPKIDKT